MSITGFVADALTFCYSVDILIESREFGTPEPFLINMKFYYL